MGGRWSLNLCVFDPSGHPVDMAAISISGGPAALPDIAALTHTDGTASLDVPVTGAYDVTVRAAAFEVRVVRVGAVTTSDRTDVSLVHV